MWGKEHTEIKNWRAEATKYEKAQDAILDDSDFEQSDEETNLKMIKKTSS